MIVLTIYWKSYGESNRNKESWVRDYNVKDSNKIHSMVGGDLKLFGQIFSDFLLL